MTKSSNGKNFLDLLLKIFLALVLILVAIKLGLSQWDTQIIAEQSADSSRTSLANCLNQKGAMMYGVDTCEFCQSQKKMFGDDFDKIKYVNCDFKQDLCLQKGLQYFPAWEIEGKFYNGVQTFDFLSQASGCSTSR